MDNNLNTKNTAFFSTANDSYIFYAATSLLSIRKSLPNAQLYILSKEISSKNKRFLKRKNIKYIELDLTYLFFQTWDYPIECYYLFAGPKIFHNLGFKYSVYIDGDILCLQDPIKNCPEIVDIGGVRANPFSQLYGAEQPIISKMTGVSSTTFNQKRLQSGVVYMNNANLVKLKFLEKAGKLFYQCWEKGIPRKGDDSLFALFQLYFYKKISPVILTNLFNYTPHFNGYRTNSSIVFFHFSMDKPWKFKPYQHQDTNQNIYHEYLKIWRKNSRNCSFWKWFQTLSLPSLIKKFFHKTHRLVNQTPFVIKGIRAPIIIKRRNLKSPPIKLYWWQPTNINNFGDIVSKDIIFNLFGYNTVNTPIENCNVMAAGSIIEIAQQTKHNQTFHIWGSGFIRSNSGNRNLKNIDFCAVRGELTKKRVNRKIPTGDPGILINATYCLKKNRHSKKIGVVIHYADMQLPIVKKFCDDPRFEVISPLDLPQNVARKIADCCLILSSSLHGLIFADSLAIPNYHIKISDNLTGGEYKFKDYYSGVNKKYIPANITKLFNSQYLSSLQKKYQPVPNLTKKQRTLIKAFPFN